MNKELGKIQLAEVGFGGYDGVMFGITFQLGGTTWAVGDFWGQFIKQPPSEMLDKYGETALKIAQVLQKAKKKTVAELVGVPVEATFDERSKLVSWRVLEEVL